jgi:hypothetical protein
MVVCSHATRAGVGGFGRRPDGEEKRMRHPSNILSNGEAAGFEYAMSLYVEQHEYEDRICRRMECEYRESAGGAELPPWPMDVARSYTDEARENACKAREIYERHMKAAAEEMRQIGDPGMDTIAACLETGDYSALAI